MLDPAPAGYTAYYVESGTLKYVFQPGFEIVDPAECVAAGGGPPEGGSISLDDDGMLSVSPGQALISEEVPTGPILSGGTSPLVMLQMTLVVPEIDQATGLPIVDPGTAGREYGRTLEQQKEACKAAARTAAAGEAQGTPATEAWIEGDLIATPAVSIAGWETDPHRDERRLPRACRK